MPKYRVTMEETVTYEFEIESESDDTVAEDAEEFFVHVEDLGPITKGVDERDVVEFEKIEEFSGVVTNETHAEGDDPPLTPK